MKAYVSGAIVRAELELDRKTGEEVYAVHHANGFVSRHPRRRFEASYREVTAGERRLLEAVQGE